MLRKISHYIIYIVPVLLFIALFSRVNPSKIIRILEGVNIGWLILGILISLATNILLATEKWRWILKTLGLDITFVKLLRVHIGSIPLKVMSPVKSGAMLRAVYLKKNYDFPLVKGLFPVVLSPLANLWAAVLIISLAGIWTRTIPFPWFILIISIQALFFLLLKAMPDYFENLKFSWLKKKIPDLDRRSIPHLNTGGYLIYMVLAFLFVVLELINLKIISLAITNLSIPFPQIIFYGALTILVSNIPITIQGLGTRETAICFFFSGYGVYANLLSLGILFTLIEYVCPVLLGIFFTRSFLKKLI